jgi:ppGpp synthetase/RelA/SpoT-type nucleotidyltranferase
LVYFLTDSAMETGDINFERKGEKAKFINISDKYANGGMFEVGDWVKEKKGTARGQVYKKLGSFIYLKDKYGNESQTLYSEDKFKKSVKPRYANGGKIENQYEGKTPSDIWNMLTLEQRQHFLYDHKDQIEAYRGEEYGELTSREIITAYRSDWAELDSNIKNRFSNHVREGQYSGGGKMADGGFVGDVAGSDLTPTMMGGGMGNAQDAILKNGGQAEVKIENKDLQFNKNLYKGVLDDFDLDGLPNADDPNPLEKQDSTSIEQMKLSNALNNVIRVKDKMDVELDEFVSKLRKVAPNDSKIYGRTKTPYSILNKLVNSRLLDEKRGLKDLVGTTVAFDSFDDLTKFKKRVEKGVFGKVVEYDDYYENPNDGYRAYHFIVEQNGTPIELQLKTDRMKQINVLSHDAYKNKVLDRDYLLYLTTIANEADKGNKSSQNEYEMIMRDKVSVKTKLSSGQSK